MKKKEKKLNWLIPVILVLIFVIIIAIIINSLRGNTTYTGSFDDGKKTDTLVCQSDQVSYPIFNYDNSNSKSLQINAILIMASFLTFPSPIQESRLSVIILFNAN